MNVTLESVQLMMQLLAQAQLIGEIIARAQAQGRDVNAQELEQLVRADDEARKRLQDAIDAARRAGEPP